MKNMTVSPVVTGVIIAVAVVVIVLIGWKAMGPRNDGPKEPINMGKIMGGGGSGGAPYKK